MDSQWVFKDRGSVGIRCFPFEISNVDVLYSLIDTYEKLDRVARDFVYTKSIDFTETMTYNEIHSLSNEILD